MKPHVFPGLSCLSWSPIQNLLVAYQLDSLLPYLCQHIYMYKDMYNNVLSTSISPGKLETIQVAALALARIFHGKPEIAA